MSEETRRRLRIVWRVVAVAMIGGALYGLGTSGWRPIEALRGAVTGLAIAAPLTLFEGFVARTPRGAVFRRLSFAMLLTVKSAIHLAWIMAGLEIGALVVPIDGRIGLAFNVDLLHALLFSAAFSIALNFIVQIDAMLGQGELGRFVLGRYHRPREEERIFLFLDLVGSTALAERIGGVRFLELLNQVYGDIAEAITEHRGAIHKYVGDEVIVTWTPRAGLPQARCVACALAIEARLAARAAFYRERFGVAPSFRCGLHLGPVVSGELGTVKREIAYLGDTVNTAARLVDACRTHDRRCIVSAALLGRVILPPAIAAEPLGPVELRGKEAPLELFALHATAVAR
jgi:adenylate cyclase